jgi:hypothetical protein
MSDDDLQGCIVFFLAVIVFVGIFVPAAIWLWKMAMGY